VGFQVTAPAGKAFLDVPDLSKRKLPARKPSAASAAAAAAEAVTVVERPVRTLLEYAAWVVTSTNGSSPAASLCQELCSVGDAARRLQVCSAWLILERNAH